MTQRTNSAVVSAPAPSFDEVDFEALLDQARVASRSLAMADRARALREIASGLRGATSEICAANTVDVARETSKGTSAALIDRLSLDPARVEQIASAVEHVADLPDPLGRVLDGWRLDNGLEVRKVTVAFGVIGMIYESRPNVTVDAAVLALKAGSAAVLRGSSNALGSNRVLVRVMREALERSGLAPDAVQLIDSPDRHWVTQVLSARGRIDLVIPRGGASLIDHVVRNAKVPVIETGVGNCHVYVEATADLERAQQIVLNAKVQRPGVCNAVETLLVDRVVAEAFLPTVSSELQARGVQLFGCEGSRALVPDMMPATEEDWATEYLDLKLAIRLVDGVDEAIEHVNRYGSHHSEAILTERRDHAVRFQQQVDAAAVYVNASTRFTDGFMFGFGAEIGISTQKLHARGPMGLAEIVTYKFLIDGDGQIRS